jgi:hypothetical protein
MWGEEKKKKEEEDAAAAAAAAKAAEEQSKKQADELVARLGTAMDAKLKPVAEGFSQLDARLKQLEGKPKTETTTEVNNGPVSVLDNEDQAFSQRLGPVVVSQINLQARVIENEILSEVSSRGWGRLIPEIKEVLKTTPIQTKAQGYEVYVRNVADMIIGREAQKGGLKAGEGDRFFIEDANSSNNREGNHPLANLVEEARDGRVEVVRGDGPEAVDSWLRNKMQIDPAKFAKATA